LKLKGLLIHGGEAAKKRGRKYEGESRDVVENTWRRNVRLSVSRDVDEN
jgi:hypothetical protein